MTDPFKDEVITLRVPLKMGERVVTALTVKPPTFGDLIRTDKYPHLSHAADRALLSALTGEPEELLSRLVPEDTADCRVILTRVYKRFWGELNLFDLKDEPKDPTTAGTPPENSESGSGTLPRN